MYIQTDEKRGLEFCINRTFYWYYRSAPARVHAASRWQCMGPDIETLVQQQQQATASQAKEQDEN